MILLLAIFIIVFLNTYSSNKEGFITLPGPVTYSDSTITAYNKYLADNQLTVKIDVTGLEKWGVPEDVVNNYTKTGTWTYTPSFMNFVKKLILNSSNHDATQIDTMQKQYPEQFFYNMAILGQVSNLEQVGKTYKASCKINRDASGAFLDVTGDGMYTLDADGKITDTLIDNATLPTVIKGFTFLNNVCNPCVLANKKFDCPFAVPSSTDSNPTPQPLLPSLILEYLWGMGFADSSSSSSLTNENTDTDLDISSQFSHLF